MTIRILLADDQALFREGLRRVLMAQAGFEVVGEAANGDEAVQRAAALQPDVVLMDLRMPVCDGVAATRRIVEGGSPARVVVLTTFDDDELVYDSLRAGAAGYLLKAIAPGALAAAIRAVARGESILDPSVTGKVMAEFARLANQAQRAPALDEPLSEREQQVLRLIITGATNKEIAAALVIAEGTVRNHVTSILGKLGVSDRTAAAVRARELGLA